MLYSAFILGLFGSVHCVAMCGPLIMAFSKQMSSFKLKLIQQFGRLLGYMVLGLIMGAIGNSLMIFSLQQKISIIIGVVLIGLTFYSFYKGKTNSSFSYGWVTKTQSFLIKNSKSITVKFFLLGIVNAILPCGLLYVALGSAVTMGTPTDGMFYMLLFGAGTFPALFAVAIVGEKILHTLSRYQTKLIPIITLTMGLFLVVRGLGLGIPYVSPKYNIKEEVPECCKHKTDCEIKK